LLIKKRVIVVGGGLAGLIAACQLAKNGHLVQLFEKKQYPFHRVCGEYVSNEVLDFLKRENLFPKSVHFPSISKFEFSDTKGSSISMDLDLGGFGISRYLLDDFLANQAMQLGVELLQNKPVENINFNTGVFEVITQDQSTYEADFVIAAHGKRSKLDKVLNRPFIEKRSPYIGVKYHIRTDASKETVALHNFKAGYCGLNAIEEEKFNLCYLGSRDELRKYGSIPEMEAQTLFKNPRLKEIFNSSDFLFEKPEVINEINFEFKRPVENHVLMAGDAAGLITPLCGNGMAMAIHSGKLAVDAIHLFDRRDEVENYYLKNWNLNFSRRLRVGRVVQRLFGSESASSFARFILSDFPSIGKLIMKNTHGRPI